MGFSKYIKLPILDDEGFYLFDTLPIQTYIFWKCKEDVMFQAHLLPELRPKEHSKIVELMCYEVETLWIVRSKDEFEDELFHISTYFTENWCPYLLESWVTLADLNIYVALQYLIEFYIKDADPLLNWFENWFQIMKLEVGVKSLERWISPKINNLI